MKGTPAWLQVTKVGVGRLRPDFLDRCRPANQTNIVLDWGQPASANPVCTGNPAVDEGELKDGHYSFPSGHTSTVFVFAVYGAAYCTWAFYSRWAGARKETRCISWVKRCQWVELSACLCPEVAETFSCNGCLGACARVFSPKHCPVEGAAALNSLPAKGG